MREQFLTVTKTARYYLLGELNESTKEIWFVFHGYAQLARDFLKDFEGCSRKDQLIVAPEGLNRFYAKGFGGNPAANWMTSEARDQEIHDYVNYLEQLSQQLIPTDFKGTVHALGFSQGVATCTRWINATTIPIAQLIIYSGEVAMELRSPLSPKLQHLRVTYVTGSKDPFLKKEQREKVLALMSDLQARIIEFDGGHEIKKDVLKTLLNPS